MEAHRANGEAAATWILVATRRPGNPPVSDEASEPWRVALQAGPGRSLPLAVRTKRNAGNRGAPKPCSRPLSHDDTPQPPHWTASVKASRALSQLCCGSARLAQARRRIAHQHLPTPPPRGRVMRPRGVIDRASRPRTGGAQSIRRHMRPNRSCKPAHKPHSANKTTVTVHYRFHPLAGTRVTAVEHRSHRGEPIVTVCDSEGRRYHLPLWMTAPEAAQWGLRERPRLSLSALSEVRDLIAAWSAEPALPARGDCDERPQRRTRCRRP